MSIGSSQYDSGGSTYGVGSAGNSVLLSGPQTNNGGSNYVPPTSAPTVTTTVIIGVSSSVFRCTGKGLKPNTRHYAYLLTKDVSADCAPIVTNGNSTTTYAYGAQLISDATGTLIFDYAFKPENSPFTTQFLQATNQTVAIIPIGKQQFKVSSVDGNSFAVSFIESKSPS